jgi:hypothetical protein
MVAAARGAAGPAGLAAGGTAAGGEEGPAAVVCAKPALLESTTIAKADDATNLCMAKWKLYPLSLWPRTRFGHCAAMKPRRDPQKTIEIRAGR